MSSIFEENDKNKIVIEKAIRITSILNKHLNEHNCEHTVNEIAREAFNKIDF